MDIGKEMGSILQEMIQHQNEKMLKLAKRIKPNITAEDLLQPMDVRELENDPLFRYEEGVLHGYLTLQMAFHAQLNL